MNKQKLPVTITIEDGEGMSNDLSDLFCWWQGFMAGRKMSGDEIPFVAEHGVRAAEEIQAKIKTAFYDLDRKIKPTSVDGLKNVFPGMGSDLKEHSDCFDKSVFIDKMTEKDFIEYKDLFHKSFIDEIKLGTNIGSVRTKEGGLAGTEYIIGDLARLGFKLTKVNFVP